MISYRQNVRACTIVASETGMCRTSALIYRILLQAAPLAISELVPLSSLQGECVHSISSETGIFSMVYFCFVHSVPRIILDSPQPCLGLSSYCRQMLNQTLCIAVLVLSF